MPFQPDNVTLQTPGSKASSEKGSHALARAVFPLMKKQHDDEDEEHTNDVQQYEKAGGDMDLYVGGSLRIECHEAGLGGDDVGAAELDVLAALKEGGGRWEGWVPLDKV